MVLGVSRSGKEPLQNVSELASSAPVLNDRFEGGSTLRSMQERNEAYAGKSICGFIADKIKNIFSPIKEGIFHCLSRFKGLFSFGEKSGAPFLELNRLVCQEGVTREEVVASFDNLSNESKKYLKDEMVKGFLDKKHLQYKNRFELEGRPFQPENFIENLFEGTLLASMEIRVPATYYQNFLAPQGLFKKAAGLAIDSMKDSATLRRLLEMMEENAAKEEIKEQVQALPEREKIELLACFMALVKHTEIKDILFPQDFRVVFHLLIHGDTDRVRDLTGRRFVNEERNFEADILNEDSLFRRTLHKICE